jgi:hypothetical protein
VAREQYPVQAWPSAVRGHRRQRSRGPARDRCDGRRPRWSLTPNAEFTRG